MSRCLSQSAARVGHPSTDQPVRLTARHRVEVPAAHVLGDVSACAAALQLLPLALPRPALAEVRVSPPTRSLVVPLRGASSPLLRNYPSGAPSRATRRV